MSGKTAIIYGANGISGTAAIEYLLAQPESAWSRVIALSRRPPSVEHTDKRLTFLSVDLLSESESEVAEKLQGAQAIHATIVLFYAYIEKADVNEQVEVNTALLDKALKATMLSSPNLNCFSLQTGAKNYGAHLGPKEMAPVPWKEDAPRHGGPPNFYYTQEDLLFEVCSTAKWHWNVVRPHIIMGVSRGNFMNFAVSLAVYAAVRAHLKEPLVYPGNAYSYDSLMTHSTALNNAEFEVWAATNKKTLDQAFNIHDGTEVAMSELWPKIADYFHLSLPEPLFTKKEGKEPELGTHAKEISVTEYMADKKSVWDEIAKSNGLDPKALEYATFRFMDGCLSKTWPDRSSLEKARAAGWTKTVDTWEYLKAAFDDMKRYKMIP